MRDVIEKNFLLILIYMFLLVSTVFVHKQCENFLIEDSDKNLMEGVNAIDTLSERYIEYGKNTLSSIAFDVKKYNSDEEALIAFKKIAEPYKADNLKYFDINFYYEDGKYFSTSSNITNIDELTPKKKETYKNILKNSKSRQKNEGTKIYLDDSDNKYKIVMCNTLYDSNTFIGVKIAELDCELYNQIFERMGFKKEKINAAIFHNDKCLCTNGMLDLNKESSFHQIYKISKKLTYTDLIFELRYDVYRSFAIFYAVRFVIIVIGLLGIYYLAKALKGKTIVIDVKIVKLFFAFTSLIFIFSGIIYYLTYQEILRTKNEIIGINIECLEEFAAKYETNIEKQFVSRIKEEVISNSTYNEKNVMDKVIYKYNNEFKQMISTLNFAGGVYLYDSEKNMKAIGENKYLKYVTPLNEWFTDQFIKDEKNDKGFYYNTVYDENFASDIVLASFPIIKDGKVILVICFFQDAAKVNVQMRTFLQSTSAYTYLIDNTKKVYKLIDKNFEYTNINIAYDSDETFYSSEYSSLEHKVEDRKWKEIENNLSRANHQYSINSYFCKGRIVLCNDTSIIKGKVIKRTLELGVVLIAIYLFTIKYNEKKVKKANELKALESEKIKIRSNT